MGKKRVSIIGSEDEAELKAKKAVKLEQKKLRTGQAPKPGKVTSATPEPDVTATAEPTPVVSTPTPSAAATQTEAAKTSVKKPRVRSPRYLKSKSQIDADQLYSLTDGLKLLRQVSLAKFDPTVELHLNLKEKGLSKVVELPHSTGKTRRVALVSPEVLSQIESGKIDFDLLLASPSQMGQLVKFAKVLGPKGLMPNPKNGTISDDPAAAAKKLSSSNSLVLKTEKDSPVVHVAVGKLSQPDSELAENVSAVLSHLSQVQKIVLKSSISPAIKLQV